MDLGKASRQRIPPPKFGKSAVIAIRGNPFTSGFNGESGQIGIGYEITFDSSLTTNIDKNLPVPLTGVDPHLGVERRFTAHHSCPYYSSYYAIIEDGVDHGFTINAQA